MPLILDDSDSDEQEEIVRQTQGPLILDDSDSDSDSVVVEIEQQTQGPLTPSEAKQIRDEDQHMNIQTFSTIKKGVDSGNNVFSVFQKNTADGTYYYNRFIRSTGIRGGIKFQTEWSWRSMRDQPDFSYRPLSGGPLPNPKAIRRKSRPRTKSVEDRFYKTEPILSDFLGTDSFFNTPKGNPSTTLSQYRKCNNCKKAFREAQICLRKCRQNNPKMIPILNNGFGNRRRSRKFRRHSRQY